MRQDTAIIIPFPNIPADQTPSIATPSGRPKRLTKRQDAASRSAASMSLAIPQAMAMCSSTPDILPDPAIVARVVIGFARRKGIATASIPKIFREQLFTLCAAGDPTALMLRDWLEGNRKLLAVDGMPEPGGAHGNGESA